MSTTNIFSHVPIYFRIHYKETNYIFIFQEISGDSNEFVIIFRLISVIIMPRAYQRHLKFLESSAPICPKVRAVVPTPPNLWNRCKLLVICIQITFRFSVDRGDPLRVPCPSNVVSDNRTQTFQLKNSERKFNNIFIQILVIF